MEEAGQEGKIIASGGQGADEVVSEAQAIGDYLVNECGVPRNAVILEEQVRHHHGESEILDGHYG